MIDELSKATTVSSTTLYKIILANENKGKEVAIMSPKKKRQRPNKIVIDNFDEAVIRRTIREFHIHKKVLPTIANLLPALQESIDFKGSSTTLRRIIKKIGFSWTKTKDNLAILREKKDIVLKRIQYLRAIRQFREEGRNIIYTDETYVHTTHISSKTWTDNSNEGMRRPISKGSRFIIVHAGGKRGFVDGALLVYKAHQTTGDYHKEMNFENYKRWITEKLIPNLEPRSVVVIDNASYHNKILNPAPTSAYKKSDMIQWLTQRNIPFGPNLIKEELYNIIKLYKPKFKEYVIDDIFIQNGHNVLRLPPYHPDLNPIEKIWASLKGYVGTHNVEMTISSVQKLIDEKVESIKNSDEWKNQCEHVVKVEDKYMEEERILDDYLDQQFIFQISESDSSSSEDSCEGEDC